METSKNGSFCCLTVRSTQGQLRAVRSTPGGGGVTLIIMMSNSHVYFLFRWLFDRLVFVNMSTY